MEDLKWIQGSIWPKMRFFLLNIWCSKCSQDFKNRGSFEKHMEFRVVEPLAIEPLAMEPLATEPLVMEFLVIASLAMEPLAGELLACKFLAVERW